MRLILFYFALSLLPSLCWSQEDGAFKFYTESGNEVTYSDVLKQVLRADVICFGELHNDPIIHWLQLELTKDLAKERDLVLGAEMFETDDQLVLSEYLAGKIKEDHLKSDAKLWPNYKTDYRPLVEWAKAEQVDFIATNAPRRYASLVSRKGLVALDSLDEAAKAFLPPLPFNVRPDDRGYAEMRDMMGGGHGHGMNVEHFIAAQALKDYTMASNVLEHRKKNTLFIHYNGSFHSQYGDGMAGYIKDKEPKLKVMVISSVSGASLGFIEEWEELGDFILVTPDSMTKTH